VVGRDAPQAEPTEEEVRKGYVKRLIVYLIVFNLLSFFCGIIIIYRGRPLRKALDQLCKALGYLRKALHNQGGSKQRVLASTDVESLSADPLPQRDPLPRQDPLPRKEFDQEKEATIQELERVYLPSSARYDAAQAVSPDGLLYNIALSDGSSFDSRPSRFTRGCTVL
jgi:hypothetical protein